MGVGRKQTPKSFVNACEVFVYTENLAADSKARSAKRAEDDGPAWIDTVQKAIDKAAQEDGWAFLDSVSTYIRQLDPAFDPRTFGHKKLSVLIKSRPRLFKIKEGHPRFRVRLLDQGS